MEPINRSVVSLSLIERAYNTILSLIAEKTLKSGDLISQRWLAEMLNMSKQPISFALRELESEGIVSSVPRVGTKVCAISSAEVWGMLQWRIAIESRAVSLACEWITHEQIGEIEKLALKLDNESERRTKKEADFRLLEVEFHQKLAEGSACQKLVRELRKLNIYFLKTMLCDMLEVFESGTKQAVPHCQIVEAVKQGNPRRAVNTITNHIQLSRDIGAFVRWYKKQHLYKRD